MTNKEAIKILRGINVSSRCWHSEKEALDLAIKALEKRQGEWIPVSERLPEEHGYYLVTTDGSHNAVIDIAEYGKFFRKPENEYVLEWNKASRVIAWQPLPEPYKQEVKKNDN